MYAESRTFGNEEIKAYALIVEETNNRFGKEIIKIPTESDLQKLNLSKEEVYKKITSIPLEEFKSYVEELCKEADSIKTNIYLEADKQNSISPNSIQDDIIQVRRIYNIFK